MASFVGKSNHPLCTAPNHIVVWWGASATKGVKNIRMRRENRGKWNILKVVKPTQLDGLCSFVRHVTRK